MNLKDSLVSILLPVHNAAKFLPECLESLLQQTYSNIQIIAIDDKSKDNSYAILKKFQKHYKGIEVYKNKKRYGLAVCYNRALKRAKGQFIAFMNPNDVNAPNRLKRQVNFLLKHPKTVAIGTQFTSIDEKNNKIERSNLPEEHEVIYDTLLNASALHPETVMINQLRLPKDLLYFKQNKYPFLFTEVYVKLFQYGNVVNIQHSLYYHREGIRRYGQRRNSQLKQYFSTLKIWLTSRTNYDYHPSLRSIFSPLVKGI